MSGYPDDPRARLYQGEFTDGDANSGVPASRVLADWANAQTQELTNIVLLGGMTPDFSDVTQVVKALCASFMGGPWLPNVTYKTGAIVRGSDGVLYELYGTADSINQNPVNISFRPWVWMRYSGETPGSTVVWGANAYPEQYVEARGQTVSRTQYRRIFDAHGVEHGAGDGANTFQLLDHRGRAIRGFSSVGTRDPDGGNRVRGDGVIGNRVGGALNHQFASHRHDIEKSSDGNSVWGVTESRVLSVGNQNQGSSSNIIDSDYLGLTGGNETRGNDMASRILIKI